MLSNDTGLRSFLSKKIMQKSKSMSLASSQPLQLLTGLFPESTPRVIGIEDDFWRLMNALDHRQRQHVAYGHGNCGGCRRRRNAERFLFGLVNRCGEEDCFGAEIDNGTCCCGGM